MGSDLKPVTPPDEDVTPAPDYESTVLGFFSIDGLHKGLVASGYSVKREMEILSRIASDEEEPASIRMAAVRQIRTHLERSLILSGHLQDFSATQSRLLPDGTLAQARISGARVATPLACNTEQMLLEASAMDTFEEPADGENKEQDALHEDGTEEETASEGGGDSRSEEAGRQPGGGGPGESHPRRVGEPLRDIGGGGLCKSAQREAEAGRELAAAAHDTLREDAGDGD